MLQAVVLLLQAFRGVVVADGFQQLKASVVHVHLTGLDVVGPNDAHAAAQARLVEVCRIFVLLVEDQKLSHDAVNVDMKWMIRTPMVVQNPKGLGELFFRLLVLACHVVSLN